MCGSEVTNRVEVYTFDNVGDFSWTLDPDIAATMIAAMVVGLVLTTKNFCKGVSRRARCTRAKVLFSTSSELIGTRLKLIQEAPRDLCSKGRMSRSIMIYLDQS